MLLLEDGKTFAGESVGEAGLRIGKVVLDTSIVGYQESLTNPANAGKLIVRTYPVVGSYGAAGKFDESPRIWAAGCIVKELSCTPSNWQSECSFPEYIQKHGGCVLHGIDTRTLAVHLRQRGELLGVISAGSVSVKDMTAALDAFRKQTPGSALPDIASAPVNSVPAGRGQYKLGVIDIGLTKSLMEELRKMNSGLRVFAYNSSAADITAQKLDGCIVSDGPEEDPGLEIVADTVKQLIGSIPVLGIGAGCLVVARALGAKTTRMKIGHRGVNYPVHCPGFLKGDMTIQNHGVCIDAVSLRRQKRVKISGYNLHDRTVEEFESKSLRAWGVQYIPVSYGPVPHPVFQRFLKSTARRR
jgi:carbamoyl-phosphate synthase small subunit